jgi:hypothetical protein
MAVRGQKRDPVAVLDPVRLERAGEPTRTLLELRPGQPTVAVDDRDPVRKRRGRALEKRKRRQRGEMDRPGDGVPYNAWRSRPNSRTCSWSAVKPRESP